MFLILACVSVLLGILTIFLWWYRDVSEADKYLKQLPGPKTIPFFGNALQIGTSANLLQYLLKMQCTYGELFKLKLGPTQSYAIITDWKIIEALMQSDDTLSRTEYYILFRKWLGTGLAFSEGQKWRQQKKILAPAFNFQMLQQFTSVFDSAANVLIQMLQNDLNKDSINIIPYLSRCTFDIICESTMNVSANAQEDPNSDYVIQSHELCRILMERSLSPLKQYDFIFRFSKDYPIEQNALKTLNDYSDFVIKTRKTTINKEELQLFDNSGKRNRLSILDILLCATIDGKQLSDEDIRHEVNTFLFAGHDTPSMALCFTFYCLAKYSKIQDKVVNELRTIFDNDEDRAATFQDLQNMTYLKMVIKESLRLYPPVPFLPGKLSKNIFSGGRLFPKDSSVIVFIYGAHRNPMYFPDPEKFDPERFSSENNPCYFMPFGTGVRNCLGQKFAMLEMKSVVSKILRHFELLPTIPAHEIKLSADGILNSSNGILLRLKKRKF